MFRFPFDFSKEKPKVKKKKNKSKKVKPFPPRGPREGWQLPSEVHPPYYQMRYGRGVVFPLRVCHTFLYLIEARELGRVRPSSYGRCRIHSLSPSFLSFAYPLRGAKKRQKGDGGVTREELFMLASFNMPATLSDIYVQLAWPAALLLASQKTGQGAGPCFIIIGGVIRVVVRF